MSFITNILNLYDHCESDEVDGSSVYVDEDDAIEETNKPRNMAKYQVDEGEM